MKILITILRLIGNVLVDYLSKENPKYRPKTVYPSDLLSKVLQPGDILLVEGSSKFSSAIKYLTQSTWSHAAIYLGKELLKDLPQCKHCDLIEADVKRGIIALPMSAYSSRHTRICRPIKISQEDLKQIATYLKSRIGHQYDLKNIFDLARYLMPNPPVPLHWRRNLLIIGSGNPTQAICSSLIAQAFQNIKYPILPELSMESKLAYKIRHYSLFTPSDFDLSPYFSIVKPGEENFNYKSFNWESRRGMKGKNE